MRTLDAEKIKDLARGAAILACGGGGDPYLGTVAALLALEEYGPPTVMTADELDDDGLVAIPEGTGAPVVEEEKMLFGLEHETAYYALTSYLETSPVALMAVEMGGGNSVVPLILGARLGIPVVDADLMGRAYPELDQVTVTLYGFAISPYALADEHGNNMVIQGSTNRWVERIHRAVVVEFGSLGAGCWSVSVAELREAAILGTLSYAERIGAAIRQGQESHGDTIAEVVRITNGYVLFRGKIIDVNRRTMRGWTSGEAKMEGLEEYSGSGMTVSFQNENLVAWRDGAVVAAVPDLITIIDSDSGTAITTERLRYGARVVVLGMPCDEKWRTSAGLALGGPSRFHYELEWAPIEELNPAPTQLTR